MKIKHVLPILACVALANNAWAKETGGFDVGVKAGTLGAGVEINYPISSNMTIAVGLNAFNQSETDDIEGNEYDIDIDLQTFSVLFNYHPFNGSFRITAGAMLNNNEFSAAATPSTLYEINGNTYNNAQLTSLEASVDFDNIAPYIGIGLGHGAGSGLSFTLDVGVLLQGEPNVAFDATGAITSDPTFQSDLAAEEKAAEDDLDEFTMYPVVSVGMSYRF